MELSFTPEAQANLEGLKTSKALARRYKAVLKALGYLETNPRHPGLHTHEFSSLKGAHGEKVFEAYAENKTSAAHRIFWHYGPDKDSITIIAITPHP